MPISVTIPCVLFQSQSSSVSSTHKQVLHTFLTHIMRLISRFGAPEAPVLEKTDDQTPSSSQDTKKAITSTASDSESEVVDTEFQHGVQSAQAMNQIWTRNDLIITYAL